MDMTRENALPYPMRQYKKFTNVSGTEDSVPDTM